MQVLRPTGEGIFSLVIIKFFQTLCREKTNHFKENCHSNGSHCPGVGPQVRVPRCYLKEIENKEEVVSHLYGFCDASRTAYAAVIYLDAQTDSNRVVTLLASKTRVAPLKEQTIPQLELLAAGLHSGMSTEGFYTGRLLVLYRL